jgi:hypothetical protein
MEITGVITGDVINSTTIPLEQRQQLVESISKVMEKIKAVISLKYEIYRGDSIQVVVDEPGKAMLVGLLMKAGLKSYTPQTDIEPWNMRVSIGIGATDFTADSITISDGEAFRLSGRGLDAMGKETLAVITPWEEVNEEFAVSTPFVDDTIIKWTLGQAAQMFQTLLCNSSRKEMAALFGVSAQTISRTLILAKEKPVRKFIERFDKVVTLKAMEACK